MHNQQGLLPFEEVKHELLALCEQGRTGTLYLQNERNRTALLIMQTGEIIGVLYRTTRGSEALEEIKNFQQAKLTFREGDLSFKQGVDSELPPTGEILRSLGVASGEKALNEIGKKILVVEDSATVRKVIVKMLSQEGFRVMEAENGFEALAQLNETRPDLILLDIVMPGIDGYKLLRTVKKTKGMEDIPVIMLTSRDKLFDKVRGKMSGSDEYLTKPFKREILMEKINFHLGD